MAARIEEKMSEDGRNTESPSGRASAGPCRRGDMKDELYKIIDELTPEQLRLLYITAVEIKK